MAMEVARKTRTIIYPDSDGKPMADNTLQFRWIVTIQGNLDALFADHPDVFVAGDLLWYPVEGKPTISQAPDVLVVFGRPKDYRGSYQQWEEDDIPPQVVFEILSPNNTPTEMLRKLAFYDKNGVEEYYYYDPDKVEILGWQRQGPGLQSIPEMRGWTSPRLQIRFDIKEGELQIYRPDGQRFVSFVELNQQKEQAQRDKEQAQRDKEQAQRDKEQAEQIAQQQAAELARLRERLQALGENVNG